MSDKNSSLINLPDLPDSIDTAVKNLKRGGLTEVSLA